MAKIKRRSRKSKEKPTPMRVLVARLSQTEQLRFAVAGYFRKKPYKIFSAYPIIHNVTYESLVGFQIITDIDWATDLQGWIEAFLPRRRSPWAMKYLGVRGLLEGEN